MTLNGVSLKLVVIKYSILFHNHLRKAANVLCTCAWQFAYTITRKVDVYGPAKTAIHMCVICPSRIIVHHLSMPSNGHMIAQNFSQVLKSYLPRVSKMHICDKSMPPSASRPLVRFFFFLVTFFFSALKDKYWLTLSELLWSLRVGRNPRFLCY